MASSKSTTIELNGKLYDATTGVVVGDSPAGSSTPTAAAKPGRNLDGFIRPAGSSPVAPQTAAAAQSQPTSAPQPTPPPQPTPVQVITPKPDVLRPAQTPVQPHQPQKTQALMRSAVKKPQISADVVQPAPAAIDTATGADAQPSTPPALPDLQHQQRLQRASQIPKSSSVSRFSFDASSNVSKKSDHLPVQPHPEDAMASAATTQAREDVAQAQPQAQPETPAASSAGVFATQLENATSHQQPPVQTKKAKKAVKMAAAGLVIVAMAGFLVYQNIPVASVKLAGTRAGFAAALPSYTPAGFSLSDSIKSAPGQVILNYVSNSDNRAYQLTQQPSDWNSQSLLDNFVKPSGVTYQTQYSSGKTIYTYGAAQATWVSNGIWYQIKGDSSLSSAQLIHIIDSL